MQVYEKLLAQWRDLQAAKQGSIKHWLYRYGMSLSSIVEHAGSLQ